MKLQSVSINQIAQQPTMRMDATYWVKKKEFQIDTEIFIASNKKGNPSEPFVGMKGKIIGILSKDWYKVYLEKETTYGRIFQFHIDEIVLSVKN
jgi:hypothetical protein